MGKHSDPRQQKNSLAEQAFRALTVPVSTPGDEKRSAARILSSVKRRPRLAALLVPVAAGAAIVTSATMITAGGSEDQVVAEVQDIDEVNEYQASEAVAVGEDEQDLSTFVNGNDGVSAKGAPSPKQSSGKSSAKAGAASSKSSQSKSSDGDGSGTVSYEPCSTSASIESGLTQNAINVYRAMCANFPQVSSYGGRRADPGSDHNSGQAVDAMIRGSVGDDITAFLIANRKELNVKYVIWEQKYFAASTGWKGRPMENRGSDTANHFDHVHVSVN